eukprot:TRINITY_DN9509_c0_g3_i1.p1 TRINITY_DN9509_c0_g3~~TRINITY_DN9509_c0_g3_i1.p1  ORF type:complete len:933 (+),score=172.00 TRINITY_DN9509_c0_g3_i1:232-3030(+)
MEAERKKVEQDSSSDDSFDDKDDVPGPVGVRNVWDGNTSVVPEEPAFRHHALRRSGTSRVEQAIAWANGFDFQLPRCFGCNIFSVDSDKDSTHIWGQSRFFTESARGGGNNSEEKSESIENMVKGHAYNEEMQLQLRDSRVRLTYLDAFVSDGHMGRYSVRVFSVGATLLEYLKVMLACWTYFVALTVVFFWKVLEPLDKELLATDLGVDIVYALCLVVQLRTTVLDVQRGREICDVRKVLRLNFTDPCFWADVVSCVPLIVLRGFGTGTATARLPLVKVLRAWRLTRTPPEHQYVPSTVYTLIQLLLSILMGGHFMACIWFYIVDELDDVFIRHGAADAEASDFAHCYTDATSNCFWYFYAVAMNMGVYLLMGVDKQSHSTREHLFTTICTPVGCVVNAYLLGKIILIIQRQGAIASRQNERMREISEAMKVLALPAHLKMRMMSFFTYERIHRSGRLFHVLFADLSPQLRFELQLHLYLELVCGSGLFRQARPCVVREIVGKLEDVIFIPGDWIARYGDYGDSMFFILSGEAAVIHKDTETQLKTLKRGSYFGEVALLTGVPRTAYVRANSFCIMARLTKEGFTPIVRRWPNEIDVLLTTVDKETDRAKIKVEASRHYGIRRPSACPKPSSDLAGSRRASNINGKTTGRRRSFTEKVSDFVMRRSVTVASLDSSAVPGTRRGSSSAQGSAGEDKVAPIHASPEPSALLRKPSLLSPDGSLVPPVLHTGGPSARSSFASAVSGAPGVAGSGGDALDAIRQLVAAGEDAKKSMETPVIRIGPPLSRVGSDSEEPSQTLKLSSDYSSDERQKETDPLLGLAQRAKLDALYDEVQSHTTMLSNIQEQLKVIASQVGQNLSSEGVDGKGESVKRAMQEVMQDFIDKDIIDSRRMSNGSIRSSIRMPDAGRRTSLYSIESSLSDQGEYHGISAPFT